VGSLTSHNPIGLHGLLRGELYFTKARGKETSWKMNLGEMGWGDMEWTGLAQERDRWRALEDAVMNLQVP
jgi:hypothetical protein